MKINAHEMDIIDRVEKITLTDYQVRKFEDKGYVDPYNLMSAIEDLLNEVETLQEQIDNVKIALHHEGLDYLGW